MNILIVDDREDNLYLLESLFKASGYDVQKARNGAEALDRLSENKIDLIISDILMPVMDGFQLCRKIKTNNALCDIPFIVYTATYTGPQDEAFALKIGADRFIEKPCEPDILLSTAKELLDGSKRRNEVLSQPPVHEEEALKLYSERLVRKLEQKMLEAESEISARQEAERALRESEARLIAAQRLAGMGDLILDMETGEVTCSDGAIDLLKYDKSEDINYDKIMTEIVHPDDLERVTQWLEDCLASDKEEMPRIECRIICKDGEVLFITTVGKINHRPEKKPEIFASVQNITERKHAEAERERLQSQLTQAQKMEAVGQLAGGVAHDFNNILQVILGYTKMLTDKAQERGESCNELKEIYNATSRAATLTRQLLAFSRRQVMQPSTLDLNSVIENLLKMLRRVIGEDIEVQWLPGHLLGAIFADAGMLEQVLMNLCVNARDAMPQGGTLTIETQNMQIDSDYCTNHPWAKTGQYILLIVTDTGCGIDNRNIEHVFEPFFTTKEEGKGTGLGLATVYGIVKQHDGMISVYSEMDKGTTFKIYIPVCEGKADAIGRMVEGPVVGGNDTILLAEDEETVRSLAVRILRKAGYQVFEATNGEEAVNIFRQHSAKIDLLLLDVIMPKMGGRDAYECIQKIRADVPALFSSGYSANAVHTNFVLHEGLQLIQKPFSPNMLLRAVRAALDRPSSAGK